MVPNVKFCIEYIFGMKRKIYEEHFENKLL